MDWIHSNEHLVQRIAKRYQSQGIELDELLAAGRRGLLEAARRYDPGRGVRFGAYAAWWIRKYMRDRTRRHRAESRRFWTWLGPDVPKF